METCSRFKRLKLWRVRQLRSEFSSLSPYLTAFLWDLFLPTSTRSLLLSSNSAVLAQWAWCDSYILPEQHLLFSHPTPRKAVILHRLPGPWLQLAQLFPVRPPHAPGGNDRPRVDSGNEEPAECPLGEVVPLLGWTVHCYCSLVYGKLVYR